MKKNVIINFQINQAILNQSNIIKDHLLYKHNNSQVQFHIIKYSPIFVKFTNAHNSPRLIEHISNITHLKRHWMYVMYLDTTLYACSTGHRHGRHLKIQMYHNHRHLNTKYSNHRYWIQVS